MSVTQSSETDSLQYKRCAEKNTHATHLSFAMGHEIVWRLRTTENDRMTISAIQSGRSEWFSPLRTLAAFILVFRREAKRAGSPALTWCIWTICVILSTHMGHMLFPILSVTWGYQPSRDQVSPSQHFEMPGSLSLSQSFNFSSKTDFQRIFACIFRLALS